MSDLFEKIREKEAQKAKEEEMAKLERESLLRYSSVVASRELRRERRKEHPFLSPGGGLIGLILRIKNKKENQD